ncbi:uncharacterized protein METZ01_LOCUS494800, partial [marine metagenome]
GTNRFRYPCQSFRIKYERVGPPPKGEGVYTSSQMGS